MANEDVFTETFRVAFRSEATQFLNDLKKTQNQSRETARAIRNEFNSAFQQIAGFASIGVFTNFIRAQANAADQAAKTADALGVQTERLQALRFAARAAGIDTGSLDKALFES